MNSFIATKVDNNVFNYDNFKSWLMTIDGSHVIQNVTNGRASYENCAMGSWLKSIDPTLTEDSIDIFDYNFSENWDLMKFPEELKIKLCTCKFKTYGQLQDYINSLN